MDETTIVALFTKTAKKMREVGGAVLQPHGVVLGQNLALDQLWVEDGLTPGELAARMGVTGPTAVRMAQRMEESGLVSRRRDDRDGRLVRVYLTEHGRALRGPVEDDLHRRDRLVLAGLTAEDRARFGAYLTTMLANLDGFRVEATQESRRIDQDRP